MTAIGGAVANDRTTATYEVGGVRVAIRSSMPEILEAIHGRLRRLAAAGTGAADLRIEFRGRLEESGDWTDSPARSGRPVYDLPVGEVVYFEAEDHLSIRYGDRVRAACDLGRGRARIGLSSRDPDTVWLAAHPIFTLCLVELMRRRGRFGLHAAALAVDGRALLLAGTSGAGKSTLTLALLRAGFGFMGDDTCFIASGDGGPRIHAFPDEVDVAEETVDFFPELHFLRARARRPGAAKRALLPEEVYDVAHVAECRPATLVFPAVGRAARSVLEPMRAADALLELVPNVLLTHPARARAHLDAIGRVVEASRCYRLTAGRDFDAIPAMLRAALAAATA